MRAYDYFSLLQGAAVTVALSLTGILMGVPLGLIPGTEYDESSLDLLPGDVVVFASDGILESENASQEEFGLQRLSAVLSNISPGDSARAIAERILAETDDRAGATSDG